MSLNDLWFLLISVLFVGFFFLEGFDFGVGMSLGILPRNDSEKRMLIRTIGPFWDANEVWLITAIGAMFAAFPHWYSTLLSGYYLLFTFILLGLILRGVAFEFRNQMSGLVWRKLWDICIIIGSCSTPLLMGIIFAGIVQGVPIGSDMNIAVEGRNLINLYTVWAGVAVLTLCLLHGFVFISLRTEGDLRERSNKYALVTLPITAFFLAGLAFLTSRETDLYSKRGGWLIAAIILGIVVFVLAALWLRKKQEKLSFIATSLLVVLTFATLFIGLFPRVMVSSLDSAYDLTIYNAVSSPYTLKSMTIVAAIFLPFVLGYQCWSYYVFRKRVSEKELLDH
ncbi:cytochrome d ubiquinol oxidase subunit II [Paenibacillus sp. An7]|uniref:cytochrome d ubiquinol oxidase subunit II n=1 Tax=Paenibacillus sp. An7 TaxID=2689577 RepID=UPI00135C114E|nr:cytochrome d ubiquinol oxidase subunit II [Paenibacillus sp. An7]